ncbi:MAG: GNAT family protein [Lentisphaerota bacterium]
MVKLRKFEEADIPRLIGRIPDERFLRQWAGHHYQYPLDRAQLLKSLERTRGGKPSHFMFTAFRQGDGTAVGHIELMNIDYANESACLGRALICQAEDRGKGLGKAMVAEALNYGFNVLGLMEINIGVFDFNKPAIACYKKLGFTEYEFREHARQFENESWNLVMMKLFNHEFMEYCCYGRYPE